MSDQSATPETGAETAAPESAQTETSSSGPPEWLAPIEDRMNELRDQNNALVEQLASLTEPEPEEDEGDELDFYDEDGDLTAEAAQQIIDQRVAEALDSRMSEKSAQEALELRDVVWTELLDRVPALADEKVSRPIVLDIADELYEAGYGALVDTPLFVDLVEQRYKASQFDERAAAEQPPQRGVVLESGAGAAPQQRHEEVDWAERIVKAAERANPKI